MKTDKTSIADTAKSHRRTALLFGAESKLRDAALHFAAWDGSAVGNANPNRTSQLNSARRGLREAALAFAELANAIDEAP